MTTPAWRTTGYTDASDSFSEDHLERLRKQFEDVMVTNEDLRRAKFETEIRERCERQLRQIKVTRLCLGQCRFFAAGRARFVCGSIVPTPPWRIPPRRARRGGCLCVACVLWRTDLREAATAKREGRQPRWELHEHLRDLDP